MDRDHDARAVIERQGFAAQLADCHRAAHDRTRTGRAKRDNQLRLDDRALLLEPPFAALDLVGIWLLVQAALAPRLELEVFHCIGDEGFVARDTGIAERLVEDAACRPDERL